MGQFVTIPLDSPLILSASQSVTATHFIPGGGGLIGYPVNAGPIVGEVTTLELGAIYGYGPVPAYPTLSYAGVGCAVDVVAAPLAGPWLTAFNGYVDDDGFTYETKGTPVPTAALSCTDGTRIFAAFDGVEQPPQGQGETAAQRVTRIADMVGWPTELRDIEAGGVAVRDTTLAQNAWTMLLNVSDTDLALLWVNREGKLAYRPQGRVMPQHELAAVVMCGPEVEGTVTITPVNISGQQPNVTRNIVSISRQGQSGEEPATVTIRDESSIARYLPHSYSRTDLIHTEDSWSTRVAEAVLAGSSWPSTAPERIELDSRADLASSAILLALEPSLSISVSDGVGSWLCEPAGWKVMVYRDHISGEVELLGREHICGVHMG